MFYRQNGRPQQLKAWLEKFLLRLTQRKLLMSMERRLTCCAIFNPALSVSPCFFKLSSQPTAGQQCLMQPLVPEQLTPRLANHQPCPVVIFCEFLQKKTTTTCLRRVNTPCRYLLPIGCCSSSLTLTQSAASSGVEWRGKKKRHANVVIGLPVY